MQPIVYKITSRMIAEELLAATATGVGIVMVIRCVAGMFLG